MFQEEKQVHWYFSMKLAWKSDRSCATCSISSSDGRIVVLQRINNTCVKDRLVVFRVLQVQSNITGSTH